MLKNNLILKALAGETVARPPVWFMRQAGRYLPEYRRLRQKYDFFTRCQTPELAAQITVQPIRRFGVDAAILFSDILVVPQAMGITIELQENVGPVIVQPVTKASQVHELSAPEVATELGYVMQAVKLTKQMLADEVPLLGFAGAPWTILCYLIEGSGSKNFLKTKQFCFTQPATAQAILQAITNTTIHYLTAQVQAGVDAVQLFDSWGGILSPADYWQFSWPYCQQIITSLSQQVPVIMFAKGCYHAFPTISRSQVAAIGVDWNCPAQLARQLAGEKITLQGNLDPARLLSPAAEVAQLTKQMLAEFGTQHYIANLGHGILPNIALENVQIFVETIKNYQV